MRPGPLNWALERFDEGVSRLEVQVPPGQLELAVEGVRFRDAVAISLEVTRIGERLRVRGEARVPVEVACVRCLQPIERMVSAALEILVQQLPDESGAGEEIPDGIVYHDGDAVDLSDEIRQAVLLEIPANPICDAGCRGLCPRCGHDLNAGDCGCRAAGASGARWDALRRLREGRGGAGTEGSRHGDEA